MLVVVAVVALTPAMVVAEDEVSPICLGVHKSIPIPYPMNGAELENILVALFCSLTLRCFVFPSHHDTLGGVGHCW